MILQFFDSTINADVTPLYDHFLKYVPDKGMNEERAYPAYKWTKYSIKYHSSPIIK